MYNNKIGIIGTGKLGLSFALLCEKSGFNILGSDMNSGYVQALNDKTHRTIEPYINEYLKECKNFKATTSNKEVIEFSDTIFTFVPTPSLATGKYQHTFVDQVVADLEKFYKEGIILDGKILVIGCTVMPTYTKSIQDRIQAMGMDVVYNPEFIAQGSIVDNLKKADMVLIGTDDERSFHVLSGIYRTIMSIEPKFNKMSPTAAEICKISLNCFLTTKVAFANMIGEIVIESGCASEVQQVLNAIGDDARVGRKFLGYGFGFGGPCLPRDNRALGVHAEEVGVKTTICQTTDSANTLHARYLREHFIKRNPDKETPFLFTQLTYKKGVDMLVESQQYRLFRDLLQTGYRVDVTESDTITNIIREELKDYLDRITFGTATNGYKIDI